jgi:hypothetical protein
VNDLDHVARGDDVLDVLRARHDDAVDLDRDRTFDEAQVLDERANGELPGDLSELAVDRDLHAEAR